VPPRITPISANPELVTQSNVAYLRAETRCQTGRIFFSKPRYPMTILIVEDNSGIRRLLRNVVADFAEEVWECSDGADALAAFGKHSPDLVLMDIRMPRQDGLASTREIRRHYPQARVVIVTDYDDDDLRKAATAAGALGYLLKQDMTKLPKQIQEVMRR
jgi:DNA-binding NarL/FixJ family response regulator